jgi:hypothetical protein
MKANHVKREPWHDPRVKAARRRNSQWIRSKKRKSRPGSDYDYYIHDRMVKSGRIPRRMVKITAPFGAPYGKSSKPLNPSDFFVRDSNGNIPMGRGRLTFDAREQ